MRIATIWLSQALRRSSLYWSPTYARCCPRPTSDTPALPRKCCRHAYLHPINMSPSKEGQNPSSSSPPLPPQSTVSSASRVGCETGVHCLRHGSKERVTGSPAGRLHGQNATTTAKWISPQPIVALAPMAFIAARDAQKLVKREAVTGINMSQVACLGSTRCSTITLLCTCAALDRLLRDYPQVPDRHVVANLTICASACWNHSSRLLGTQVIGRRIVS